MTASEFDQYASDYESALQKGIAVSGESSDYFAVSRVQWLVKRLSQLNFGNSSGLSILDFGCGTGNSVEYLLQIPGSSQVIGVDTSEQSLVMARKRYDTNRTSFFTSEAFEPKGQIDLAFCNGVFHHIPVDQRSGAIQYVWQSLKPGGLFAFWENNPWNPGTRYVMSRIPFDRDAIVISILEARRLLSRQASFHIEHIDTRFYFPKALRWFRFMEPILVKLPLGAQYLVLARKSL